MHDVFILFIIKLTILADCGRVITEGSGSIQNRDLDNNNEYDDNENCTWIFQKKDGYFVQLYTEEFDLEIKKDCAMVSDECCQ